MGEHGEVLVREQELPAPEGLSEHENSRAELHGIRSHGRRIGVLAIPAALVRSGVVATTQLLDPKPVKVVSGPAKAMLASSTEAAADGCPAPVDDDVETNRMRSDLGSPCEAYYDAAQAESAAVRVRPLTRPRTRPQPLVGETG